MTLKMCGTDNLAMEEGDIPSSKKEESRKADDNKNRFVQDNLTSKSKRTSMQEDYAYVKEGTDETLKRPIGEVLLIKQENPEHGHRFLGPQDIQVYPANFRQSNSNKVHDPIKPLDSTQWKPATRNKSSKYRQNYGTFECELCNRVMSTKHSLATHLRTHRQEKPYDCDVCGRSFSQQEYLRKHRMLHTGERPFACSQCGEGFIDVRTLERHIMSHTGFRPFSCAHCGRGFKEKPKLRRHVNRYHVELPEYKCSSCGAICGDKWDLKLHQRKHEGPPLSPGAKKTEKHPVSRRHLCNTCGEYFATNASLVRHCRRKHPKPGEKPAISKLEVYDCSKCDKSFKYKWDLKHHIKLHDDPEAFKCFSCGNLFSAPNSLAVHRKKCFNSSVCAESRLTRKTTRKSNCAALTDERKESVPSKVEPVTSPASHKKGDINRELNPSLVEGFGGNLQNKSVFSLDVNHNEKLMDKTDCYECISGFLEVSMLESHLYLH